MILIYWKILHDALCSIKKDNPKDYQWMSVVFMSMGNALNILGLLISFHILWDTPILLFQNLQFIAIKPMDSLLKFFLQFLMVPVIFNLYCLSKIKRKERELTKETSHKGKLFAYYMLLSIIGLITSILIAYVLVNPLKECL